MRRRRGTLGGPLGAVAALGRRRRRRRGLSRLLPHRHRRRRIIRLAQGAGTVLSAVAFAADMLDDVRRVAEQAGAGSDPHPGEAVSDRGSAAPDDRTGDDGEPRDETTDKTPEESGAAG